jgi:hypothetical protein
MYKFIAASTLAIGTVFAQEEAAAPPPPPPPQCPVSTGSFAELNAIGVVLINQGSTGAGEDCLAKAVAATVPTYRALSDVAAARGDWRRAATISALALQIDGTPSSKFFHSRRLLQGGDFQGSLTLLDSLSADNQDDYHFFTCMEFHNFATVKMTSQLLH